MTSELLFRLRQDTPIQPASSPSKPTVGSTAPAPNQEGAQAFGALLQQQLQSSPIPPLTFSGHALQRMQQRQINLTQAEAKSLAEAAAKARDKGAKETLVLAEKAAFVISVTNNTVITVMDRDNLKDNVFTQIDSAIII